MNDSSLSNDSDKYQNKGIIANFGYNLKDNLSIKNSLRYSDSQLNYDEVTAGRADENNKTDDKELTYNLRLIYEKDNLKNSLVYSYTDIERATKTYTNSSKNYYGYRDAINLIGEYDINLDNKIVYGLDNEFDSAKFQKDWPTDYLYSDEAIYSQYIDYQTRPFSKLYTTFGFRRDDHTTAGDYNTGRATIAYKFDNLTKIRSSFGTGIRYPSLYDYFYGTVVSKKEDLKPEKSKSFDIGYETKLKRFQTNIILSLYKIAYEDPLEGWQSNNWTVKNSNGKIKSKGIELSTLSKIKENLILSLNYNYTDTYDGADCDDPDIGNNCIDESMVRVPRHAFTSVFKYKFNKHFSNKFSFRYLGEVRDYGNNNNNFKDVILDDYIKFDYLANFNIFDNYNLHFSVDNIFNQNYEQAFMYSTHKRTFNLGLKKIF